MMTQSKAAQALDEHGDPIPDVISAEEMTLILQAEGIHLASNCAKCVLRRGDTYITLQERHVRVAPGAGANKAQLAPTTAKTPFDLFVDCYLETGPAAKSAAPVAEDDDLIARAADAYCGPRKGSK